MTEPLNSLPVNNRQEESQMDQNAYLTLGYSDKEMKIINQISEYTLWLKSGQIGLELFFKFMQEIFEEGWD